MAMEEGVPSSTSSGESSRPCWMGRRRALAGRGTTSRGGKRKGVRIDVDCVINDRQINNKQNQDHDRGHEILTWKPFQRGREKNHGRQPANFH